MCLHELEIFLFLGMNERNEKAQRGKEREGLLMHASWQ